jgi:hypothetical protein
MNPDPKDIVCEGITKVNETLEMMMSKVMNLKEYHSKHTSSVRDTEILFLMTDPLYFQCKVLEMEINFWKQIITRFSHRVYADFFKLLKSLYDEEYLKMTHVFHKDLCFDTVKIEEILSLKKSINAYIESKKNETEVIKNKIFQVSNETERGVNVQSILNSENFALKTLQNKICFWEDCLNSHNYYHEKFLTSLKLKVLTMNTEMNASMDIDSYDASETLKMNEMEEKQIDQSMNVSRVKPRRRWTISNIENVESIIENFKESKLNEENERSDEYEEERPEETSEQPELDERSDRISKQNKHCKNLTFFLVSFVCFFPVILFRNYGAYGDYVKSVPIPKYYPW